MRARPLLALLAAGCAAEVQMPFDGDRDGLLDHEEIDWGTDPETPDSDDDGWLDGDEVKSYTDPLSKDDHPYTGGWDIGSCRSEVEGTAVEVGSIAPNFTLYDQHGDPVKLHDFCHEAVLIVIGAGWCGNCIAYRPTAASLFETYEDRGFMILDLYIENPSGGEPSQDDLVEWVEDDRYAVLADVGSSVTYSGYFAGGGIPAFAFLGPGAEVVLTNASQSEITTDLIEEYLPR